MDSPIDHPHASACPTGRRAAEPGRTWLAALLRMFADMACRLR